MPHLSAYLSIISEKDGLYKVACGISQTHVCSLQLHSRACGCNPVGGTPLSPTYNPLS